jgi:fructosamine-3-kinase
MVCAIQYIERKDTKGGGFHGGYVVNDGTNTVFVDTRTESNLRDLYLWLGNGDDLRGMRVYRASLRLPRALLVTGAYNGMVASIECSKAVSFKGE